MLSKHILKWMEIQRNLELNLAVDNWVDYCV